MRESSEPADSGEWRWPIPSKIGCAVIAADWMMTRLHQALLRFVLGCVQNLQLA